MDWASIITALIAALVPTGGIVTLFTLKEKKTSAQLENDAKVIANWERIAEERTKRATELKEDLDRKDDIIQEQWKEISHLRNELDHTRTRVAVSELMKCNKTGCKDRIPPFGSGQQPQLEGGEQ